MKNLKNILLNNVILLGYHLLILGITILVYSIFISNNSSNDSGLFFQIWVNFWVIFPLLLYVVAGYLLTVTKYVITDFASLLLFGSIGVLLWVYCIQHPTWDNGQWILYYLYTINTWILTYSIFNKGNDYVLYIWNIIYPIFLCFLGLELKRFVAHRKLGINSMIKQESDNLVDPAA